MATDKRNTSFRLTDEARWLIEAMAQEMGISQAAVLEVAVRDLAKVRGVQAAPTPPAQNGRVAA